MLGLLILIVWVLYSLQGRRGGEGKESDNPQHTISGALSHCFVRLMLCLLCVPLFALLIEPVYSEVADIVIRVVSIVVAPAIAMIVLWPSCTSWVTARFGLVRTSYWLGRIASLRFYRNVHSGGLFRAYQAAQHLRSPESRQLALLWLKTRSQSKKGVVYSGDMVMSVILEAELQRPGDVRHVASRLLLLDNMGLASVPGCISMLALKYALAPVLVEARIDLALSRAIQWNSPGRNRIARYIIAWHDPSVRDGSFVSKLRFRLLTLSLRRYPVLLQWFDSQRANSQASSLVPAEPVDTSDPYLAPQLLWQARSASSNSEAIREALLAPERIDYFRTRATSLGIWQPEQAIDALFDSVERVSAQADTERIDGLETQSNETDYEALEEQSKALSFIAEAIRLANETRPKRPGIEHFADWFRLLQVLDAMKTSREVQLMAFSSIHLFIWNWVVDLWNRNGDRALVHFIAQECAPLAHDSGHQDLYELFFGLLNRVYK